MSKNRFDYSSIKTEIKERNDLQEDLTELSVQVMGTDEEGGPKNNTEILAVIQALYDIQEARAQLELAKLAGNLSGLNLKNILSIKQRLIKTTQKFDHLVTKCLSSYSSHAQQLASDYLENLKILYALSNTAINQILNQRYQDLQANSEHTIPVEAREPIRPQERPNHQQIATQILNDFNASHQRALELVKKLEVAPLSSAEKLTSEDEATYLRNEILDTIDIEIQNMKQLSKNIEKELPHTNYPLLEQESILKSTQEKVATIAEKHSLLGVSATLKEAGLQANFNIPARPYIPATTRANKLKRKQEKEADSDDTTAEKKVLLEEISRIQKQIQDITEHLTNEIPKAVFNQGLKTYKRNALLTLSRNLYVPANPSLGDLRECIKKFGDSLAKCQGDAKLRQGIIRKNCRTLIDNLAKDLNNSEHVFKRNKR